MNCWLAVVGLLSCTALLVAPSGLLEEESKDKSANELEGNNVAFYVYSRLNPVSVPILAVNATWDKSSTYLDPTLDIAILIHGFTGSSNSSSVVLIRNAIVFNYNTTVIAVDWHKLANVGYYAAVKNTKIVAHHLRLLLLDLVAVGFDLNRVHIIGFSLGAHVAGFAGNLLNGRVGRITGLDPAGPGFINSFEMDCLDPSDAKFVLGVHTGAGVLALYNPVGHADFYPNGGRKQPYCALQHFDFVCNHFMAYRYFAASVTGPETFLAKNCSSWKDFNAKVCHSDELITMGYHTPSSTRGKFFLDVKGDQLYQFGVVDKNYFKNDIKSNLTKQGVALLGNRTRAEALSCEVSDFSSVTNSVDSNQSWKNTKSSSIQLVTYAGLKTLPLISIVLMVTYSLGIN